MLKKIIIVILIIIGYKFFFDSKNLIERCSDHSYLIYSAGGNIVDFPEPIKKSDLLGKKVDMRWFHRNLISKEDKKIK